MSLQILFAVAFLGCVFAHLILGLVVATAMKLLQRADPEIKRMYVLQFLKGYYTNSPHHRGDVLEVVRSWKIPGWPGDDFDKDFDDDYPRHAGNAPKDASADAWEPESKDPK